MPLPRVYLLLLFATGCDDDSSLARDAAVDTAVDAEIVDFPTAPPCSSVVSSTVMIAGQTYGYAALGNVDAGGEAYCGGPPEAVTVVFAVEQVDRDPTGTWYFSLLLPVATGTSTVQLYDGGSPGASMLVTLDVTSRTVDGAGPGLTEIVGTLSGPVGGQFTAPHCARLSTPCI